MTAQTIQVDAFLCDSIEGVGGKLYAIGIGWNSIGAMQLPTRHPRIGVGLVIHTPYTATNQPHEVLVQIEDQEGNAISLGDATPGADPRTIEDGKLVRLGGQFNVGRPPGLAVGDEQVVTFALQFDGVEFQVPGLYSVIVTVDGSQEARLPFRLLQLQQMHVPVTG